MDDVAVHTFWINRSNSGKYLWSSHEAVDIELTTMLFKRGHRVLDLGAGECAISNWCSDAGAQFVVAVDYAANPCRVAPGVIFLGGDVRHLPIIGEFDLVLAYGFMIFLPDADASEVYRFVAKSLSSGGRLIVKQQFSVTGRTVNVDGMSSDLKTRYVASYRTVDDEISLIRKAGMRVLPMPEYPLLSQMNRWPDTRWGFIVAERM